ncbi:MAG: ABC transporter ATP-binding protein [bacterium]|nr:ABC transporter ATP-binding protein [bacterium]
MLEVKDLTCGYDSKFVLQDINFKIEKGEICGIIGPNGSGKTTLLRAITKVIKPRNGKMFLDGKDIAEIRIKELSQAIAIVSQTQDYVFDIAVDEFVLLGRIPYRRRFQLLETKQDENIAQNVMVLTDTFRFKDRFIGELSGGERQRVVIARALTQEPKLLLLDEPTAHLDINHQIRILDLIRRLNRENGLTVIMVLHDLNLASEYCDRLILLNNGFIHKIGTPQEVLTYQIIEEVYNTVVVVKENPISSKPYVVLVSKEKIKV